VGVREFANLNPLARYRGDLTVEDVVNSRMVADPLHKLDCCVITDGGGAILLTTEERARDLKQPPVYVLGAGGAQSHWNISQCPDYTTSAGAPPSPTVYAPAAPTPDDVDVLHFSDS